MTSTQQIRFRNSLFPKNLPDLMACVFLCTSMPTIYWFEIYVVVPSLFNWYLRVFHIFLGTFVLVNLFGNFIGIMVVETSTRGHFLPSQVPPGWHVCAECEAVAPPRSRHCHTCRSCILKKDHHCLFTGCCVGVNNHRYFFIFLVYIWLSTFYISGLNMFFIWPYVGGMNWLAIVRLILPGVWLVWNPCLETLYAFLFSLSFIGFLFLTVLMHYYTSLLFSNITTHEVNTGVDPEKYNMGRMKNIEVILGSRWYLTWLFPSIHSPLPFDGFSWSSKNESKSVRPKIKFK